MIVIGKGSMIRPDALTPHIIDDEMRVVGELKAEGFVTSAYRRSDGPGFYLLAEGPSIDAVRERIDTTPPLRRREPRDGLIRRDLRNLNPHTATAATPARSSPRAKRRIAVLDTLLWSKGTRRHSPQRSQTQAL
jgi:hypothetical protein